MPHRKASYTVGPDDIARGARHVCGNCPHGLAARRDLRAADVSVDGFTMWVYHSALLPNGWYPLPAAAKEWIDRFDHAEDVVPMTVELSTEGATLA